MTNQQHQECLHKEDIQEISRDLRDIKEALNIKGLTNGQIKRRVDYIGKRSEEEDIKINTKLSLVGEELHNIQIDLTEQKAVNQEIKLLLRAIIAGFVIYFMSWVLKTIGLGI